MQGITSLVELYVPGLNPETLSRRKIYARSVTAFQA